MKKVRKSAKRLNKREMGDLLQDYFSSQPNETLSFKQIFRDLRLNTHPLKMLAIDTMEEMAWDDLLSKVADNTYRLNTKGQVQEGVFRRKANGKNSFLPDDGGKPIFVSERNSMFALDGDRVRISMMARRRNHIKEAMVTEILSHARDTVVGKLVVEDDFAFLVTESNIFVHDIFIPKKKLKGGKTGEKVVVRITQWPSKDSKNIVGEVIDVLGKSGDNTVEMHAILAQYGLPYRYPKEVEDAATKINAEITPQDIAEREDFRDVLTFTIDPRDAKDFDDALSLRVIGDGFQEVGVHIADVSHYVTEGSIIDKEAQKRATSVYLVDRTIPMLPERLCNFICSLRPDEEKLCYSVIFKLDDEANIVSWHLAHTIIRSDRRFAYEEVQTVIDDMKRGVPVSKLTTNTPDPELDRRLVEANLKLHELAQQLRQRRFKSGAVKFESEELHFDIDDTGKPTRCYFKRSLEANQLIEEFMLLANRTVAEAVGMGSGFSGAAPHKIKGNNKKAKDAALPRSRPARPHQAGEPARVHRALWLQTENSWHKERHQQKPQRTHDRRGRKERTETHTDRCPARHDEGQIHHPQHRPLRTGLRLLHPLHQPHPPLSRPHGSPPAHPLSEWRTLGQPQLLRRPVQAQQRHGADGTKRRTRLHKVQDGGIYGRTHWRGVRCSHQRHSVVWHLL